MIAGVLKELRIKHYIKNILVFVPAVFSLNFTNRLALIPAIYIFLAFCAGSSFVYIVNDIADREKDALHPRKKNRPIASGRLSLRAGAGIAAGCFAAALVFSLLAARHHGLDCTAFLLLYIGINILYSFALKNHSIVDVLCIAAGFVIRVMAGAAAIGVVVSDWLLLTVMALSLFMGFGKRRNEMRQTGEKGETRRVLKSYSVAFLDKSMYSMMTLAVAFYTLWSIDKDVMANLGTDRLMWTVPFVITAFLRYSQCIETDSEGDPTGVILGDKPLLLTAFLYVCVVLGLIYL